MLTEAKPTNRSYGFRFSWRDLVVFVIAVSIAWSMHMSADPFWWVVPAVVAHFFLFCNVFLVWQRLEWLWAATFVVNVTVHNWRGIMEPLPILLWQLPITLLVIVLQMRSPHYHGVWARRINPRFDQWLEGKWG